MRSEKIGRRKESQAHKTCKTPLESLPLIPEKNWFAKAAAWRIFRGLTWQSWLQRSRRVRAKRDLALRAREAISNPMAFQQESVPYHSAEEIAVAAAAARRLGLERCYSGVSPQRKRQGPKRSKRQ